MLPTRPRRASSAGADAIGKFNGRSRVSTLGQGPNHTVAWGGHALGRRFFGIGRSSLVQWARGTRPRNATTRSESIRSRWVEAGLGIDCRRNSGRSPPVDPSTGFGGDSPVAKAVPAELRGLEGAGIRWRTRTDVRVESFRFPVSGAKSFRQSNRTAAACQPGTLSSVADPMLPDGLRLRRASPPA